MPMNTPSPFVFATNPLFDPFFLRHALYSLLLDDWLDTRKGPTAALKKRKRVVTPDKTSPSTKKLARSTANNTLDRTNIFKWL